MQNLIEQLSQPGVDANGNTVPASLLKMRAAKTLKELSELQQQDLYGRLRAEQMNANLVEEATRLYNLTLPLDISPYLEAMNKDRD